jgi:ribonuclease HI
MYTRLKTYSDGGARGNPGPAAAAYLILTEEGKVVKKDSLFLGKRTNNQAEYMALIAALETAASLGTREVVSHLDSELVSKHLSGEYKVSNPNLQKLWKEANELRRRFEKIRFVNLPRTNKYIQEADKLVNETLDQVTKNHV